MERSESVESPGTSTKLRSRRGLLAVGTVIIGMGLTVHFTIDGPVGDFVADALYAVLVYLAVSFIAPRLRSQGRATVSYLICVAIEAAQLSPGPSALADVFPPARLVLGTTFAPVDLFAYAFGVLAALVCDRLIGRRRTPSASPTAR